MAEQEILRQMDAYYRDRAPYHDDYMGYSTSEAMERLMAPIIGLFEPDIAGRRVLEVACGTGNWTQVLSRRAGSVTATDLYEECLDIARSKAFVVGNVRFQRADALALEELEGSFQAAFCADFWSHVPLSRIPRFLEGLHSRLETGSRVVVIDMSKTAYFESIQDHVDSEGNVVQRRSLPNGKEYLVIKNFPDALQLRSILKGWARDISFHEEHGLGRWVLRYKRA